MRSPTLGARAFIPVALAAALIIPAAAPAPAAAASGSAADVIRVAKAQLGDPWRFGAVGPRSFDCSGLVVYAFAQTGNLDRIGGGRYRTARAMYDYFRRQGKAFRTGRVGDLVVWGGGSHIGIYIGDGKAVSTLSGGVTVHRVHAVTAPFTAFLRTGLSGSAARSVGSAATGSSSGSSSASSSSSANETRRTVTRVNFRTGPGLRYRVIRVLPTSARVTVLGRRADGAGRTWYRVRAGTTTGWLAAWLTR